jgi:cyclopropane-fatty-acyl-phospholipid synthase
MLSFLFSDQSRLAALRAVLQRVGGCLGSRISVKLWDGSVVPLGPDADPDLCLAIHSSGVVSSLLRCPTLDNFVRHYAAGRIEVQGADLYTFAEQARVRQAKGRLGSISKWWLAGKALPFLFHPADHSTVQHRYADEAGFGATHRDNQSYLLFHYDAGNEFFRLFLDQPWMQYSCAHFTDWSQSLEQAQVNKMEMICRKLRLRPGDTMLDVGCGWGGFLCYAAKYHGVRGHGVTLSKAQVVHARERIRRMGLEDRVSVEEADANAVTGSYDKVVSVGMLEHVGTVNYPRFMAHLNGLLKDRGVLLLQMITRGAKTSARHFSRSRPEHRLIRKYIFPGGELGHIGNIVESLEGARFEVHDVEGWREHYAMTLKMWSQRLSANERQAVHLVGAEKYRMWTAYTAGMSFGFLDGSLRLFQVVASKHAAKGVSAMPCSRADLYDRPMPAAQSRAEAA